MKNIRPIPPLEIAQTCEIEEEELYGNKVYKIHEKENNQVTEKKILYFHGGAYMAPMTEQHWEFLKQLVSDTHMTIIIPEYPIAPKYCYTDTIDFTEKIYKNIINENGAQNIIAIGDSAGGGLILSLEEKLNLENIQLPKSTILISPWLDISMTNEKINEVEKYDKDLNKEKLLAAGMIYARGTDTKNYLVSPIYGNLEKLENVTILTGTYDILNPDVKILEEKSQNQNVKINIKNYEKATHIWIINKNCNQDLINLGYSDLINIILN